MKIIKDNFNRYPRKVICKNCESEIELEDGKDVIVHKSIDCITYFALERSYTYQWICPLCKQINEIYF